MNEQHAILGALLLTAAAGFAPATRAGEPAAHAPSAAPRAEIWPCYDFPIHDGLYATVTSMTSASPSHLPASRMLRLEGVEGFARPLRVRVALQAGPAPLTLLLPGMTTRAKHPIVDVWESHLFRAGQHVLAIDSVLTAPFARSSGHGVAGNPEAEALQVLHVLEAFLRHPAGRRVVSVNFVGISYGGLVALHASRLADSGIGPALDRVLAFSPPVDLRTSARTLDGYREQDLSRYGLLALLPLKGHQPSASDPSPPFEPALMRAGLSYVLGKAVKKAAKTSLKLHRRDLKRARLGRTAPGTSLETYVERVAGPYWTARGEFADTEELWSTSTLRELLPRCPENVHVVVAADDPLNRSDQLARLAEEARPERLTVLPDGGHVGYQQGAWLSTALPALLGAEDEAPCRAPAPSTRLARN